MEYEEQNEQELDIFILLSDFLKISKRFWILLILLVGLCSAGLTFYQRVTYEPTYEAYASFTVRVANPLQASVEGFNSKTAEVMAAAFPSIVSSNILEKKVMEDLNVTALPSISVSAMGNAGIITIHVRNSDPQHAFDVLNSVITHYPDVAKFVVGPTALELLDESGVPAYPVNAFNSTSTMIKGGLIGALIWCVLIACMALLKNTIHNEDELRRTLNFECLSQIPDVKISKRQPCPLILDENCSGGFEESVRLLRVRVEKIMEEQEKQVLLVSSAIPGEGKTTISLNLAASLAQSGKRVLLIDCDLRNPSIGKALQMEEQNGLVSYMNGEITIKDAIQSTRQENLHVITGSGGTDEKGVEVLSQIGRAHV